MDRPSQLKYITNFALNKLVGPQDSFTYQDADDDDLMATINNVEALMVEENFSLIANTVQRRLGSILQLCKPLSMAHGRLCDVNSYYSKPDQQGFMIHFDAQDTFILQQEGALTFSLLLLLLLLTRAQIHLHMHSPLASGMRARGVGPGSKTWDFWEVPGVELPLNEMSWDMTVDDVSPDNLGSKQTVELTEGDVLYVPRGSGSGVPASRPLCVCVSIPL
jgi:ribosomal protein L16 Arg81 hydroxylase